VVEYLSVADVIALHNTIMELMGWSAAPLRDEGLLESALNRPRMAAHYEGADLVRQAILLAIGISQNQPFVDGNKRTAFLALITFLGINGLAFEGDHMGLARQIEMVAERTSSLDDATDNFENWLRERVGVR
jgi:death-on-curing family protein